MNEHGLTRRSFLAAGSGAILGGLFAAQPMPETPGLAPLPPAEWVWQLSRMSFGSGGEAEKAALAGAEILHTNLIWPYYPLRRDGGGLRQEDDRKLRELVAECKRHGLRLGLGLPPFPPVNLVKDHPDWRVHPDASGSILQLEPREDNLGTRLGCNLGPWGNYLVELCAELVRDYGIDSLSFDGNYHPALCHCPACREAYRREKGRDLPGRANLDDIAYREYLLWRGEKLEAHYHALQQKIKAANPDAAIITWTVNAGRYGHFLHSPRAMPTRLNRQFDAAMQEWWLDETNLGASVAPSFGAAYLRAVMCGRPAASEPYLMSRGNPYGTDSFPAHERLTRTLLAVTHGCITAESLGWPGHAESAKQSLLAVKERAPWLLRAEPLPWGALLVSEQTRQFYAYRDIAERFLPPVFGAFRAALEEHLPVNLINDWDLNERELGKYAVLILPNAAALSDQQIGAVREFVRQGGGLVATGEASLCDELGRPRADFALGDVLGVRYQGRPAAPLERPALDENFTIAIDETYWKQRVGVATLTWAGDPLFDDERLHALVPIRTARLRAPLVKVEVRAGAAIAAYLTPEGSGKERLPSIVRNRFGKGQALYFAAGLDAALWSYAYPYQRIVFARALSSVSSLPPAVRAQAPLCVQMSAFTQLSNGKDRLVAHLFNGVNTGANHGLPAQEVPLREETLPVHGIRLLLHRPRWTTYHAEPGHVLLQTSKIDDTIAVHVPRLDIHLLVVGET